MAEVVPLKYILYIVWANCFVWLTPLESLLFWGSAFQLIARQRARLQHGRQLIFTMESTFSWIRKALLAAGASATASCQFSRSTWPKAFVTYVET